MDNARSRVGISEVLEVERRVHLVSRTPAYSNMASALVHASGCS
jgi:hypothetical protein